jgi:hypothetical protein
VSNPLLNTTVPLPTVPVTNEAGQTDQAWQRFFMSLHARSGGNVGVLGVPGGASGNVQFNNAGQFGGYSDVQLTTHIQVFAATLSGAVPPGGAGTTKFLRQDATFATAVTSVVAGTNLNVGAGPGGTIITTGTLAIQNSPTFTTTNPATPVVINSGSAVPAISGNAALHIVGADSIQVKILGDGFGANGFTNLAARQANGTQASPTATLAGQKIIQLQGTAHNGTGYTTAIGSLIFQAQDTISPTDFAGQWLCSLVPNTGSAQVGAWAAIGSTPIHYAPVVFGTLASSGPFGGGTIVTGSTASIQTQGGGGVLTDVLNVGTVAAPPMIISGAGAPTGTQTVSTLYIRSDGSVGAGLYFANAGGTYNAVAGI